jgi:uncharacterized protein
MFQGGEPTLAGLEFFRYFVSRVRKSLRVPVSYALQTNGLLIDDGFAAFLSENNFLTGLSLDGDRETNDRNRVDNSGRGVFDRVMASADILRRHNADFNILSVVDEKGVDEIDRSFAFFRQNGFRYIQFIPRIGSGSDSSLSAYGYERFLKKTFDLWYEAYTAGEYISVRHIDNYMGILLGQPPEACSMCGVCGNYFTVEANGDIYPCDFYCDSSYKVGTLYDDKPFEINEKHKAFIDESLIIHKHCSECVYHYLCRGGCRRDRINGFTENRYCAAYTAFFEYAGGRMHSTVRRIQGE